MPLEIHRIKLGRNAVLVMIAIGRGRIIFHKNHAMWVDVKFLRHTCGDVAGTAANRYFLDFRLVIRQIRDHYHQRFEISHFLPVLPGEIENPKAALTGRQIKTAAKTFPGKKIVVD